MHCSDTTQTWRRAPPPHHAQGCAREGCGGGRRHSKPSRRASSARHRQCRHTARIKLAVRLNSVTDEVKLCAWPGLIPGSDCPDLDRLGSTRIDSDSDGLEALGFVPPKRLPGPDHPPGGIGLATARLRRRWGARRQSNLLFACEYAFRSAPHGKPLPQARATRNRCTATAVLPQNVNDARICPDSPAAPIPRNYRLLRRRRRNFR